MAEDIATRVARLEKQVQELRTQHQEASQVDSAILNRVDRFFDAFQQERKAQRRSFDDLKVGQIDLSRRLDDLEEAMAALVGVERDHKTAIETLGSRAAHVEEVQAEQTDMLRQILALLNGPQKRND